MTPAGDPGMSATMKLERAYRLLKAVREAHLECGREETGESFAKYMRARAELYDEISPGSGEYCYMLAAKAVGVNYCPNYGSMPWSTADTWGDCPEAPKALRIKFHSKNRYDDLPLRNDASLWTGRASWCEAEELERVSIKLSTHLLCAEKLPCEIVMKIHDMVAGVKPMPVPGPPTFEYDDSVPEEFRSFTWIRAKTACQSTWSYGGFDEAKDGIRVKATHKIDPGFVIEFDAPAGLDLGYVSGKPCPFDVTVNAVVTYEDRIDMSVLENVELAEDMDRILGYDFVNPKHLVVRMRSPQDPAFEMHFELNP